jgi:hypothetical protein
MLKQKIIVELLWWVLTFLVIIIVLFPIWEYVPTFPFVYQNALLIAALITFSRYSFLLPITFLARMKWVKLFLILSSVLFFFILSTALGDFRNFLDEKGLPTLVTHLHVEEQTRMITYIRNEMIFFGVGSIIAGIVLPFRMLISIWRVRNKGTV